MNIELYYVNTLHCGGASLQRVGLKYVKSRVCAPAEGRSNEHTVVPALPDGSDARAGAWQPGAVVRQCDRGRTTVVAK